MVESKKQPSQLSAHGTAHHLAPTQEAILEYLRDYKQDPDNDGNSPTYREIADYLDKNPSDIYRRIQDMSRKGLLKINKSGKIVLVGGRYVPPE